MNIKELSALIRRRRSELSLDQQSAAKLAGVSVHTLSDIESEKGNPTLDTLCQVLDTLGLELTVTVKKPAG